MAETINVFQSVAGDAKIIIVESNGVHSQILSERNKWSMGRQTSTNHPDIPLMSPISGRDHGDFLCLGGEWYYCYRGSTNPTFLNGRRLYLKPGCVAVPTLLRNGDVLRIDYENLNTPDANGVMILFLTDQVNDNWAFFPLNQYPEIYIGRDPQFCQLVQPLSYISARHACIFFSNGYYYVADCNSRAGTWLNNVRVSTTPVGLREKDKISICDCHFIFTTGGILFNQRDVSGSYSTASGGYVLQANICSKIVPDSGGGGMKELVRDIKLRVKSHSLVALLGGSGAGKSTVMNAMVGTDQQGVDGEVLFYGENLYANFERLKYLIGSVPQLNELHEMLSVEEELKEAAILRLPADTNQKEIKARVSETLRMLNLEAVRKSKISKLSGGEKKRVNIGIELVADRAVLCLDEPDAGLDPGSKRELFTILRRLADEQGKSIMVIIHDVTEIDLFDQVILLAKVDGVGRLAFNGTPAEARSYFGVQNLKDAYDRIRQDPRKYVRG